MHIVLQTMQNHNQTWIFIFLHLVSNGVGVGCKHLVGHNSVLSFCTPSCSTAVFKGSVFLQFWNKIQSSMHQIFTQMHLSVSVGQSHIESHTELFTKKFLFRFQCDGYPIFLHLSLLPIKNPPKQEHAILPSPPSSNFLSINPPQYKSNHHKQDLLITTSKFVVTCSNFKL